MAQHECLKCHATVELPDGRALNVCPHCGAIQAKLVAAQLPQSGNVRRRAPFSTTKPLTSAVKLANAATPIKPIALSTETVFLETESALITSVRIVLSGTTYPLRNITSVALAEIPPMRVLSAICLLVSAMTMSGAISLREFSVFTFGTICATGISGYFLIAAQPTYILRLSSASGEVDAVKTKKKADIAKLSDAINAALVYRG